MKNGTQKKDETSEKSLTVIKKQGMFSRFYQFLKNLIKKDNSKEENQNEEVILKVNQREDFLNTIRLADDSETKELMKKLENGEIEVQELTDEELDTMIEKYKKDIENKENKVAELKWKLRKA